MFSLLMEFCWWWSPRSDVVLAMSVQIWLSEQVRSTSQNDQFVHALYVLVSVRLHTWAGGSSLIQYVMQKQYGWYIQGLRSWKSKSSTSVAATSNSPCNTLNTAQLLSYFLVQETWPDWTHGGQVENNSDRLYTNYFPRCHRHACF